MNAPRLLSDPEVPAFQRDLLRAWSDEGPSSASRDRAMAFAALAGVAGTAAGAGSVAANAGAVGGSIAPKAMSASGLVLLKWVGVGSVLIGLTAGGAIYSRSHWSEQNGPSGAQPSLPGRAAAADFSQAPASQQEPTPESTPHAPAPVVAVTAVTAVTPPTAPTATGPAASFVARTRSSSTPASTLSDQIASLDRARTSLAAGDAPRAVQLVDDYERRFPRGAFFQEAEMLRIEALVREGNRDAANGAADRFLAAYPASPHIARLRALTGSAAP